MGAPAVRLGQYHPACQAHQVLLLVPASQRPPADRDLRDRLADQRPPAVPAGPARIARCTRREEKQVRETWLKDASYVLQTRSHVTRALCQPNVVMSCGRPEQVRGTAAHAAMGGRQLHYRVGLRLSSRDCPPRKVSSSPDWETASHRTPSTHEVEATREGAPDSRGMRMAEEPTKWGRSTFARTEQVGAMDRRRTASSTPRWLGADRATRRVEEPRGNRFVRPRRSTWPSAPTPVEPSSC